MPLNGSPARVLGTVGNWHMLGLDMRVPTPLFCRHNLQGH